MTRYIHTIAGCLLPLLVLGACTQYEEDFQEYGKTDTISFVSEPHSPAAVQTKSGDHFIMEIQEWAVEPATKAAPVTSLSGNVGIYGYEFASENLALTTETAFMPNDLFTFSEGTKLLPDVPRAWHNLTDGKWYRFYAYAPYSSPGALSSPGEPTLSYTVPASAASQTDYLYAVSADYQKDWLEPVPLTFNHALCAVQFKLGFEAKVKSVSIKGIYGTGVFTFKSGSWGSLSNTSTNYSVSFGSGAGEDFDEGDYLTEGDDIMMLLPQTMPAGSTLELVYDDDGDKTISASLEDLTLPQGKKILCTIYQELPEPEYVYFDLAAGPISITGSTYSGYVYVNGVATLVSGSSPSDQKYYVYQSTTITGSNDKDHTGYANSTDFDNKENIRLPSYSELTSGGKTWSQFITNNSDIASVINGWTTATTGSRTGTLNRITINGNVTVDMTMDNLWCSFQDNTNHRLNGGILIGSGTKDSGYRYEKVTLRLKGDNRFCNILYYGHPNGQVAEGHAYLHVTSASGDGSYDGSLTVTLRRADETLAGACTVFGSGDNDDTPPCNSLVFYGGTIFVAGSILVGGSDSTGILGGGTNNHCNMVINDAVITSVAYSNGAAIGGGGGHSSGGGQGTVTINAGKVYAYQFGTYSGERFLSTAAIGGGSSYSSPGSSGYVTINGGEVYAQSIGGVAIGGGSSYSVNGGLANVTITGGSVIAKSIPGTINGNAVTAGNSIGGGKGGKGEVFGYGGSATVTLSGGTLLAGSVGGGGTISANAPIGTAVVDISGDAVVQGQFIMAAGANTPPTFTMRGGIIQNSQADDAEFATVRQDGGAVYVEDGSFTMSGGTIRNCSARYGGAVYLDNGDFEMTGGTIRGCTASLSGGAVYVNGGSVEISGGATIEHNVCSAGNGGGICLTGGSFTMTGVLGLSDPEDPESEIVVVDPATNPTISYNAAARSGSEGGYGGGLYVASSTYDIEVELLQGSFQYNSADVSGGGVGVDMSGGAHEATITLGVDAVDNAYMQLVNNEAVVSGGGLYVSGSGSNITINSGTVQSNTVSAYVANPNISNDGGEVELLGGDVDHVVVTFDPNAAGEIVGPYPFQNIVTATNSHLKVPSEALAFERELYNLVGWNTAADGSGTPYALNYSGVMNISSNLTLYAQWVTK